MGRVRVDRIFNPQQAETEDIALKETINYLRLNFDLINKKKIDILDFIIYYLTEVLPKENNVWMTHIESTGFMVSQSLVSEIHKEYTGTSKTIPVSISLNKNKIDNRYVFNQRTVKLTVDYSEKFKRTIKPKTKIKTDILSRIKKLKDQFKELNPTYINEVYLCINYDLQYSAIITMWTFTIYYLRDYIFKNKEILEIFNLTIKNSNNKKIDTITNIVDFEKISDSVFIDFLYRSKIIQKIQMQLLESSLNKRNALAHPTDYQTGDHSAVSYVEEILNNILKEGSLSKNLREEGAD